MSNLDLYVKILEDKVQSLAEQLAEAEGKIEGLRDMVIKLKSKASKKVMVPANIEITHPTPEQPITKLRRKRGKIVDTPSDEEEASGSNFFE